MELDDGCGKCSVDDDSRSPVVVVVADRFDGRRVGFEHEPVGAFDGDDLIDYRADLGEIVGDVDRCQIDITGGSASAVDGEQHAAFEHKAVGMG